MKKLFLFAVSVLLTVSVMATDFVADGLYFSTLTDNTVQVVKPTEGKYVGDIVIPATVDYNDVTYSVTAIGDNAFQAASQVTSVTLPLTGITSIGSFAFNDCTGLTSFTIPASVTSIGERAFFCCDNLKDLYLLATDPASYNPGNMAFSKIHYGSHICTVHVPAKAVEAYQASDIWKVFILDAYFFEVTFKDYDGTELKTELVAKGSDATAPADPQRDGYTFTGWDKDYTNVTFDLTVTAQYEIITHSVDISVVKGQVQFNDESFTIQNQSRKVSHNSTLKLTIVPYTDYQFKEWSDGNTDNPRTISVTEDINLTAYCVALYCTVTFKDYDGTVLKTEQVSKGASATAPEDPSREGYTFTGWDIAFDNVTEDLTVTAKYELTTSGICGKDGEGNLADNLTWSFDTETGVLTIEGTGAMYDYDEYNDVYAPWQDFEVKQVVLPDGLTTIGNYAFYWSINLTSADIPEGVTTIGNYAFFYTGLTSVVIPASVTTIGNYAFAYTGLTSVVIPESVTTIGEGAFAAAYLTTIDVDANNPNYCSVDGVLFNKDKTTLILYPIDNSRTTYSIPNSVTKIGTYAFFGCNNLTSIVIPASVTSIGKYAFSGCYGLETIYDYAVTPQELIWDELELYSPFDGVIQANCKLYVPAKAVEAYKAAEVWKDFDIEAYFFDVTFFDYDGTELKTEQVSKGSAATAPADPTREGYTFTGWDPADYSHVTTDLTVTAQYKINTYTVTFFDFYGNPIGEPQTVEYGASAVAPEAPEVTGYHFVDWDSNYKEIYSDMTVKAVYEKKDYTVKFLDWDGSELSSQVVKFEEAAIAPEDPKREGYTFTGWDKAFDVITEDLTVTAQYVQNDPTGILSPTLRKEGEKVLRDGVLYILRDGKMYNTQGAHVQ